MFRTAFLHLLVGTIATFLAISAQAETFYLDSATGDDADVGTSAKTAWKTLDRANRHKFLPGDRLLLKSGGTWEGILQPQGSGAKEKPIVVDRYGDGPKPALYGRGKVPAVVRLENQSYWEIRNLEITNHAKAGQRDLRGVLLAANDFGYVRHVHLIGLDIHDVNGVSDYRDDGDALAKTYGGIATIISGDARPTAWDDLLIENCTIRDVGPAGVAMLSSWMKGHRENDPRTWLPSKRVVIRGNKIERTARNGMIVRGCDRPLIERNYFHGCAHAGSGNACFTFHCDDALVQFNEACHTRYNPGDTDASGFDSDYYCRRSVFQYNYSHDNEYGFMLVCNRGPLGFNDGTIVRHNISQNDGGNIFRFSGAVTNTQVYNNTIYAGRKMESPRDDAPPRIIYFKSWNGGWSDSVEFKNNIFVNNSPRAVYEFGQSKNNRFVHNLFFGQHPATEPADRRKLTVDPRFANPGKAGQGLASAIAAYTLLRGSPALGLGAKFPLTPTRRVSEGQLPRTRCLPSLTRRVGVPMSQPVSRAQTSAGSATSGGLNTNPRL